MIKVSGAVWKAFMGDEKYWGAFIVEDEIITVNGAEVDPYDLDSTDLADDDKLTVDGGCVYPEGDPNGKTYTLSAFYTAWKRNQDSEILTFAVPKDKVAAVKAAVKAALKAAKEKK